MKYPKEAIVFEVPSYRDCVYRGIELFVATGFEVKDGAHGDPNPGMCGYFTGSTAEEVERGTGWCSAGWDDVKPITTAAREFLKAAKAGR